MHRHAELKAVVLADDLTGALEMGALLAQRRLGTAVTPDLHQLKHIDAVVVDTRSRNVAPESAAAKVTDVAAHLPPHVALFKKVDSTLRGPVKAELAALCASFPSRPLVFSPAYPAMGRVVRAGRLFVNGIAIDESDFANDPRWPVRQSQVFSITGVPAFDAESDADLARILDRAPEDAIVVGSSGLGGLWANRLPPGEHAERSLQMHVRRPLVVCGSMHPASLEQTRKAAALGVRTLIPQTDTGDGSTILRVLADSAAEADADLFILFGGDTAAAVLDAMGVRDLWPVRELLPGVVLSRPAGRDLLVVTKAGGFGGPDVIEQILGQLE